MSENAREEVGFRKSLQKEYVFFKGSGKSNYKILILWIDDALQIPMSDSESIIVYIYIIICQRVSIYFLVVME